jgi:hypothetical protein
MLPVSASPASPTAKNPIGLNAASHQRQPICHRPIRDTRSRMAAAPPVQAVTANAASSGPSKLGRWVGHPLPW